MNLSTCLWVLMLFSKPTGFRIMTTAMLFIPTVTKPSPKPFKFANVTTSHSKFKEVVSEGWNMNSSGFWMFRLVKKLKNLKNPLESLLSIGNFHDNVVSFIIFYVAELGQGSNGILDLDPFNLDLREEEVSMFKYNQAMAVKGRVSRNRIDVVTDVEGNVFVNENVSTAFVNHYESFLGQEGITSPLNTNNLFDKVLSSNMVDDMILNVSDKEIKDALFSMGNDKSPGPDGFTAAFFKEAWEIVGHNVINAVKEFFTNGKLLKELNHTYIALIPKVQIPMKVTDYRPISCYNVILKCISKIIANHIKNSLKVIISPNQSAFVPDRSITDNILLTHELMHNYHLDRGDPRCAFKVDIQKAYDTVDWDFLKAALTGQGNSRKSNSKVAWEVVCLPKDEGGLGIRRLDSFNKALMAAHIWKLLNKKNSLWVTWIHIHKINDRNFWDIPCRGNMSWAWRKVLQLRHIIRKFIWHKIGDGQRTSIWYDHWCHLSPLAEVVSYRDIHRAGLLPSSKVADVMVSGSLVWPIDLSSKYSNLLSIAAPSISAGTMDTIEWKSSDGVIQPFSARVVWNSIRPHDNKVDWFYVVWFPGCIPRHAFNLWLVVKKKLKTQDRLASWNVNASLATHCTLCESQPDSHDHLFFECPFSNQVWCHMRDFVGLPRMQPSLELIVDLLSPFSKSRTTRCVVSKLVLAATAYFLWRERNDRLFKKGKNTVDHVIGSIKSSVRLKLLSCRFKKSKAGLDILKQWNISEALLS
ncbi:auxin efflux carrier [Tanacetum coccineum]